MFVPYRERKAEAQGRRESLLIFLSARFGQLPDTLREAIARIQDSDTLDRLLTLAATCTARDEFERALAEN